MTNATTPIMAAAPTQTTSSATRAMLHLTNGSAIVPKMREVGIAGRIVPWDDVLHEGPVPAGVNIAALRDLRADFLATFVGPGESAGESLSRDAIARGLALRDAAVEQLTGVEEIVLWFEHDLFDQLQILQILDRMPTSGGPRIAAVPGHDYLGHQPAARFPELFAARTEITSSQRSAARDAWLAFQSADPRVIVDALPRVTALPHLASALLRHLQQFPSVANGTSRTEQQALDAIAAGVTRVRDLFVATHLAREEAMFMGDAAFLFHLRGLFAPPRPLLRVVSSKPVPAPAASIFLALDDVLQLTVDGRRMLDGEADRIALSGIDRWLGGVHLTGHGPLWRWDEARRMIRIA